MTITELHKAIKQLEEETSELQKRIKVRDMDLHSVRMALSAAESAFTAARWTVENYAERTQSLRLYTA